MTAKYIIHYFIAFTLAVVHMYIIKVYAHVHVHVHVHVGLLKLCSVFEKLGMEINMGTLLSVVWQTAIS